MDEKALVPLCYHYCDSNVSLKTAARGLAARIAMKALAVSVERNPRRGFKSRRTLSIRKGDGRPVNYAGAVSVSSLSQALPAFMTALDTLVWPLPQSRGLSLGCLLLLARSSRESAMMATLQLEHTKQGTCFPSPLYGRTRGWCSHWTLVTSLVLNACKRVLVVYCI